MLLVQLLLPILNILAIWLACTKTREVIYVSLAFSIIQLIQTLIIMAWFDPASGGIQFIFLGKLGIDGISQWLVWLVSMLMPIVILSTWKTIPGIKGNKKELLSTSKWFQTLLVLIGFWSIAVFTVLDLLLFYISFEGVLIPMYFQITFYGSRNRKMHASYQFFIYTLFGSQFLFLAQLLLYLETGTTDYQTLLTTPINQDKQYLLWQAFFICFAVKVPVYPFHIWLQTTHVEAPTPASVILAAIQLKLGTYGFLRYSIPLFPHATIFFRPLVMILCTISVLYSCIAALSQIDLKVIIAYSSQGHCNTGLLALFSNDIQGICAAVYFMISHGLVSSGLFLLVGVLYDRYHTRTIRYYRGLVMIMPLYVLFLLLFSLANVAVPGTAGFIGEFMSFIGLFHMNPFIAFLVSSAIVLAPSYMLWTLHRLSYGAFTPYISLIASDLTRKEFHLFLPQLFFIFYQGLYPQALYDYILLPSMSLQSNYDSFMNVFKLTKC